MANEAIDTMFVEFKADYSQLMGSVDSLTSIFNDIAASAEESSASISESMSSASESFTVFGESGSESSDLLMSLLDQIAASVADVNDSIQSMSSDVVSSVDESTSAIQDLSSQFDELSVSASSSAEAIAEASSSGASGGSSFMDLFNKMGFGIMNFHNFTNIAQQVGSALLGPAISGQQMSKVFDTLMGSTQAANTELQKLDQFADTATPFKSEDIEALSAKLLGFHFSADQLIPTLKAIGDNLSAIGEDTPSQMQTVVDVFGKIQTEGKLSVGTMTELSRDGIDAWGALENATGKNQAQLQTMISKGLFPAKDAINDLTQGIEANPLYAGQMANQMGTVGGLLSTLESAWNDLMKAFGTPIITALQSHLSDLDNLLSSQGFKDFAGSIGQGIVNAFSLIGDGVNEVTHLVSSLHLGDIFGDVTKSLSGLSKNSEVTSFLASLSSGFRDVSDIVGGTLQTNFKTFSQIAQSLGNWWHATMGPAIQATMPSFEKLGATIATLIVPAIANFWSSGQQIMRDLLPPLTKAFETVAPILVQIGGIVANQLGNAIQFLTPYIKQATGAITDFAGQVIQRVQPVIQLLWSQIQNGINFILPIWNAVWPSMQETLQGVWNTISGAVQFAWSLVSGIVKVGLDVLSGNWSGAWKDIQSAFKGAWEGMQNMMGGVWNLIKGAVGGGINAVIGFINDFINGLDKIHVNLPGGGGLGFSIPDIPYVHFATGGYLAPGGIGVAGENGPELIFGGTSGAHIYSNPQSNALLTAANAQPEIHVHVYLGDREVTDSIMKQVVSQVRGGGHPLGAFA